MHIIPVVVIILLATAPRVAVADPAADAEAAIKRGIELRRRGDDARALEEFKAACALVRSPRALGQLGFAEQALGRWRDAEQDLGQALAGASADDAWIKKNRATLERSRASVSAHLGSLEVLGGPEGAEIRVEGRLAGRLPLPGPLRVAAGTVGVEVRAEGHLATSRSVTIAAGELSRETVNLQRVSPLAIASRAPTLRLAGEVTSREGAKLPAPGLATATPPWDPRDEEGGGMRRSAAWATGGFAVLFAGGFVAGLLARAHYAGLVRSRLDDRTCAQAGDQFSGSQAPACAAAATNRDRASMLGVVSGGLAGAFAVTSIVLFASAPATRRQALACVPTGASATGARASGEVYVSCHFRF
jgi:hypothetical protein